MTDLLQKLEAEIEQKKAELAELETAARVLRRLQGHPPTENGTTPTEDVYVRLSTSEDVDRAQSKKSAREWAIEIMTERGPMHYRDVAEEAVSRGFRSLHSSDRGAPARTFMSLLYRNPEMFEPKGKGIFALKTEGTAGRH